VRTRHLILIVLCASALAAATARGETAGEDCTPRVPAAYAERVTAALSSPRDVWGEALLRAPNGPTYADAAALIAPLLYARSPHEKLLTRSGVYYLPFGMPAGDAGAIDAMLHVADGSEILAGRATGQSLEVFVGRAGRERYGSCLTRLEPARLGDGWLPILRTAYRDEAGGRYTQESFAARRDGALTSFIQLVVSPQGGARVRIGPLVVPVAGGATSTLHVRWAPPGSPELIGADEYRAARISLRAHWRGRLAEGAEIEIPERRVQNAQRALLVQALTLTWRYSLGNAYEQFSFPETIDQARVLGEYGFANVERTILLAALPRRPTPYPSWKMGEKLLGFASHYRLFRDQATLEQVTPTLGGFVAALEGKLGSNGLLARERYSSDIPDQVYGLHAQSRAWQGLREIADAWDDVGQPALATRARTLAGRLGTGIRAAARRSQRLLPDGSLFLPMRLLEGETPYRAVTESRAGSYWNLVAPYALASGLFPPTSRQATGTLRYLTLHGARLLGLVRTGAYVLYGPDAGTAVSGVNPVYGNNASRFLAALDRPDRLVLALYGQLAAGMTRQTFVGGEGTSIAPLDGAYHRTTYLPPNAAANASFLETLRLQLVHETPDGLELAFATPRGWLAAGKRLAVRRVPTRFGPVSYSIEAGMRSLRVTVEVPQGPPPKHLRLRLRLPAGERLGPLTPALPVDARTRTIDLSGLRGTVELEVARGG
jgi:hypothetical protein